MQQLQRREWGSVLGWGMPPGSRIIQKPHWSEAASWCLSPRQGRWGLGKSGRRGLRPLSLAWGKVAPQWPVGASQPSCAWEQAARLWMRELDPAPPEAPGQRGDSRGIKDLGFLSHSPPSAS